MCIRDSYKYHARAVVFNEKHLLRLWDVAFNGYTGGMGVKPVKWFQNANDTQAKRDKDAADLQAWQQASVALDEPMGPNIADMFVMCFSEDPNLDNDLPNPINFSSGDDGGGPYAAAADPDNLYNTHLKEMDVFHNRNGDGCSPVSYTNLTLPTICSV